MKDVRFFKSVVFINALVPLSLLLWDWWSGDIGANPTERLIRNTGLMALVALILSLAITPVRKFTNWNWLSHVRRMLGLYAFFFACLHFTFYFGKQNGFSVRATIQDVRKSWYILVGLTGLLAMVPLAATSTNGAIKKMGSKNWKRLHRLAYVAGIAGVIHYYWIASAKDDVTAPLVFIGVLAILFLYRIFGGYLPRLNKPQPPVRVVKPRPVVPISDT